MTGTTTVELHAPEVRDQDVVFRWTMSPATDLYRGDSFTLSFPDLVDPAAVPDRLWWTVFLLCVHSHWALLRPCTVHLPVRLAPGEAAGWERMLDGYVATMESQRGGSDFDRQIEIVEHGEPLGGVAPLGEERIYASAFSGGKDSLVQAAMLCELGCQPILVTTTSPMPPLHDHGTRHRRRTLEGIAERRDVTLVEVRSDYRALWDNAMSVRAGYPFSVNEITDTFLYTAVLVAVGYALGATHLFLASENEVSQNDVEEKRYLQHRHFMYSAHTQAAIRALLAPTGMYYGSLLSCLHSSQVQELLTTRYKDLQDLQFSCWRTTEDRKACSECSECKRLAWVVMSLGGAPSDLGIDLVHMLNHLDTWQSSSSRGHPHGPNASASRRSRVQTRHAVLGTSLLRVMSHIALHQPLALMTPRGWRAVRAFIALRRAERADTETASPQEGYRPWFLETVDPTLQEGVRSIVADHFAPEDETRSSAQVERLAEAIQDVTAPWSGTGDDD